MEKTGFKYVFLWVPPLHVVSITTAQRDIKIQNLAAN
jgi:hypothetical protein